VQTKIKLQSNQTLKEQPVCIGVEVRRPISVNAVFSTYFLCLPALNKKAITVEQLLNHY